MIKYATIGRGNIATQFIEAAKISGKFKLQAVYSRNLCSGIEFAKTYGCTTVYTDLNDIANDPEIDAVYVASPNVCHPKQCELLLRAKKHIICEKPIVTNANEYIRLKSIADEMNVIFMEAIIPVYVESRKNIKKAIAELGNISIAKIDYCQRSSRYDKFKDGKQVNIFDMSLAAGTLMDIGVYCVYAAVDLFGMPDTIYADASFLYNNSDGAGCAIFGYKNHHAVLTYSKTGQSVTASEIVGDDGSVTIDKIGLYADAFLHKGNIKTRLDIPMTKPELMSFEATAFYNFINRNRIDEYNEASLLCKNVHKCMDEIKKCAKINYPIKEN